MQGVLNLTFYCFYPTQVRPESDLTDYLVETWTIWPLLKKDISNPIYILEPMQNMYNMQRRKDSSKPTKTNLKNQTKPNLPNKSYKTKPTEKNLKNLPLPNHT